MKVFLLAALFPLTTLAQGADPLAVTLPSGKVVHFQTLEQKGRFEAAQRAKSASPNMSAEWAKFNADQKARQDHLNEVYDIRTALDKIAIRAEVRIILFTETGVEARVIPYVERDRSLVHSVEPGNTFWIRDSESYGTTCSVKGDFRTMHAINDDSYCLLLYPLGIEDSGSSRELQFTIDAREALKARKFPIASPNSVDEALALKPELKPRI